jgi:tetratricopeptide (TPR) repeat protein
MALEATRLDVVAYGNPWLDLADLYVREARFPEALSALREVPRYRAQRPPHIRDSDRNEGRRGLSAFYLVVGRHEDALRITEQALVAPDRRYHNSRDPDQDEAIAALLDRSARRLAARRLEEDAAARPWYERVYAHCRAAWLRIEAFASARRVSRIFQDDDKLVGFFRIGSSKSAVTPPWLVGELVDVLGAGVVRAATARARALDHRELAPAYYDAFEAEAALAAGDADEALHLAARSLSKLPPGEALLRARLQVIVAEAYDDLGRDSERITAIETALSIEPGTVRRLDVPVPVRFEGEDDAVIEEVREALERSPAFTSDENGLTLKVERSGDQYRACLLGRSGAVLGCGERAADFAADRTLFATWMLESTHAAIFSPRIDLSQGDIGSLDGSNEVSRDGLRTLFDGLGRDEQGNAPPVEVEEIPPP